jgi:hypothetical protein
MRTAALDRSPAETNPISSDQMEARSSVQIWSEQSPDWMRVDAVELRIVLALPTNHPKSWSSRPTQGRLWGVIGQKPPCLLAEPLVSDRVAVLRKNVSRTSGRSCDEQSSRSTAREARRLRSAARTCPRISTPADPPQREFCLARAFSPAGEKSAKLPDRRPRFAFHRQGREPLGKFRAGSGAPPSSSNPRLRLYISASA